jgi:hypothetical protein
MSSGVFGVNPQLKAVATTRAAATRSNPVTNDSLS